MSPNHCGRLAALRHTITEARLKTPKPLAAPISLAHGWLLPCLLASDQWLWGRWPHWFDTFQAGRMIGPIPPIDWQPGAPARRMLEHSLHCLTQYGDWRGWDSWRVFDYFMDWLLFGFGHAGQPVLPEPPSNCGGASERLYQVFNLETLLAWPHDYFGDLLAENQHGKHLGFYPTPMEVAHMMAAITIGEEDARGKTVCDPCLGTGRMLLAASNYSYRLYGTDINATVIKAALVNGFLYAPWLVRPFPFLDPANCDPSASEAISHSLLRQARPEELQWTAHDSADQWRFEPIKKRRPRSEPAPLQTVLI